MNLRAHTALAVLVLILGAVLAAPAAADDHVARADEVKAAFLKRFIQFVAWPDAVAPDDDVAIGVVGAGPFGEAVQELDGGDVGGHTVRVRVLEDTDGLPPGLHVLVVCPRIDGIDRIKHPRWKDLGWLAERPLLLVGDDPDFMDAGGTIGFFLQGERVRFAARRHPTLTLSSKLLRLAKVVD